MLAAYKASAALLAELRDLVGEHNGRVGATQSTEVAHLKSIFRSSPPCREDLTALMHYLNKEEKRAFTEDQRQELIDVANDRVSTTVVGAGEFDPMLSDMLGPQKLQKHEFTYNYYTDDDWEYFCSEAKITQKFTKMSRTWIIAFGLRFLPAQTYRIGLSTIIEASKMTFAPTEAYDMMHEFVCEFKMVRGQTEGTVTWKRFPSDPGAVIESYPGG